ncbi:Protein of unknown function [Pyronema omphalodes CBS 100304]|uniref:Uncharacterized protein n=1 Tax=Pyronema omphalodes (strain CBS 100304) TaxID=1076935 RepID=U4KZV4_PYROM|nr:Protein of unknown function [Pyronema omphalodes CBS 100304]
MRVAQSLADPGNADGMYFEVSLGKALWADRDPDDGFNKLNGRVMDFMGFSRIQNLGEAVNLLFRPEFDTASKSALVRGLVARGYASSASEKLVRITTIRTGSAEEDVGLCSAHGSDTFLTVDQHFARLRHHHDGTTLNPANTLDARTTIRTTQKIQTLSHVPNSIKKWLVYNPSSGSLAFSNSGYKPSMPNYQVEQIGATVLTSGSIRVRIEHVKSITRDAPAVYKVMFSSAAIDAEIGKGASFNGRKLQEAIQELDAEVKAVTELFILGDDGLKEKGCDSKFSLGAKDLEEMARLMAKKAAKPILKVEPTFEAVTVAVLPSVASEMKPVVYMEYQERTVTEQPIPQVTTTKSPRLASHNDFLAWMMRNALVNQKPSLKIMNQTVEEDRGGKPAFSEEEEVKPVEVIQTDGRWNPVGETEQQRKDEAGGHHIDDHVDEPSEKHAEEEEDDEPVFVTQRYVARRKVSPLLRPTLCGLEESCEQIKSKYSYVGANQLSRNKIVIEGRTPTTRSGSILTMTLRSTKSTITISEDLSADDFNSQLYEEYESDEYSECSLLGYAYKSTRTGDWSDFAVTDGESEFLEDDDVAVACVAQNAVDSNKEFEQPEKSKGQESPRLATPAQFMGWIEKFTKEKKVIVEKPAISQPVEDQNTTIQPIDVQTTVVYQPTTIYQPSIIYQLTVVSEHAIVGQPAIIARPDVISAPAVISQPTVIFEPVFDIQRAGVTKHAAVVRPPSVQPTPRLLLMEDSKLTKSRTI